MMMVHRLTEEQATALQNRKYSKEVWFNPEQDADGLWYIGRIEVAQCTASDLAWVKTLPLVPYKPKPFDMSIYKVQP